MSQGVLSGVTVLLVDDNRTTLELISRRLQNEGAEVYRTSTQLEAIALYLKLFREGRERLAVITDWLLEPPTNDLRKLYEAAYKTEPSPAESTEIPRSIERYCSPLMLIETVEDLAEEPQVYCYTADPCGAEEGCTRNGFTKVVYVPKGCDAGSNLIERLRLNPKLSRPLKAQGATNEPSNHYDRTDSDSGSRQRVSNGNRA